MLFWWLIFQFPRSPVSYPYLGRHWCPAPDINRDSNVSSVKTDFRYKRSFLSIAGAKVQQFWVKNKFLGYRFFFGGVFVSVWLIVLYNDVSEINCCILTDFEENEGLWLRILEKRSFGHGHVRSFSFSIFILSRHYPWPQRVFCQSLSLLRCEEGIRFLFWEGMWEIK